MQEVDCVVPAAGASVRMGRWKPLLPFGGSTIIETVVSCALHACSRVVLVTGFRGGELEERFQGRDGVLLVQNPAWRQGMFSSVQRGISEVRTRRFFVTLGDMPWITAEVYAALLEADAEAEVVFPVFAGKRGHPVRFDGRVKPAVLAADPARGSMRAIAEGFRVLEVAWPGDSVIRDVDSPGDLP